MKKKMSERDIERAAWLFLAKIWGANTESCTCGCGAERAIVGGVQCTGLCQSIDNLPTSMGAIPREMMRCRISNVMSENDIYLYPPTRAGAKLRAAFCRKQARLLSKKKGK